MQVYLLCGSAFNNHKCTKSHTRSCYLTSSVTIIYGHELTVSPLETAKSLQQNGEIRRHAYQQTWHTFPDNDQAEYREVSINNAAPDGPPMALTSTARTVAAVAFAEQQTHTSSGQDSLLHGETLLVIATRNAHYIALKLRTQDIYLFLSVTLKWWTKMTGHI